MSSDSQCRKYRIALDFSITLLRLTAYRASGNTADLFVDESC